MSLREPAYAPSGDRDQAEGEAWVQSQTVGLEGLELFLAREQAWLRLQLMHDRDEPMPWKKP